MLSISRPKVSMGGYEDVPRGGGAHLGAPPYGGQRRRWPDNHVIMAVHKAAPAPPRMVRLSGRSSTAPGRRRHTIVRVQGSMGLGDAVEEAVLKKFGEDKTKRVLESFRRIREGNEYEQMHEGKGMQQANSYIEGLEPIPFHEVEDHPWMVELEKHAETIRKEFILSQARDLSRGNRIWEMALTKDALAYGPDWRTLVLQDRGRWEPTNTQFFPNTTKIIKSLNAPTSEVFFAKQAPRTGIAPHTDFTNFILTAHLALIVPEGECVMKVGEEERRWVEGKGMIMDTSFIHSTRNDTDGTRYVLITRFWHPGLDRVERRALQFIFDCLDDPSTLERQSQTPSTPYQKPKKSIKNKAGKKKSAARRKR